MSKLIRIEPGRSSKDVAINDIRTLNSLNNIQGSPPEIIENLSVTPSNSSVNLSWTSPDSQFDIKNYLVEYVFNNTIQSKLTNNNSNSYSLTGLTNGVPYNIRIAAISDAGIGEYSSSITTTPAKINISYSSGWSGNGSEESPASASVSEGNSVSFTVLSSGMMNWNWSFGSDGGNSVRHVIRVDGVDVYSGYGENETRSFSFYVSAGTTYTMHTGYSSMNVTNLIIVDALPPEQVVNLSVDSTTNSTINISWSNPSSQAPIVDYSVEYTPIGSSPVTVLTGSSANNYQISGLSSDTEYTIRVAAISEAGLGIYSTAVQATATNIQVLNIAKQTTTTGNRYTVVGFPNLAPEAVRIRIIIVSGGTGTSEVTVGQDNSFVGNASIPTANISYSDAYINYNGNRSIYKGFGFFVKPPDGDGAGSAVVTIETLNSDNSILQRASNVSVSWYDKEDD